MLWSRHFMEWSCAKCRWNFFLSISTLFRYIPKPYEETLKSRVLVTIRASAFFPPFHQIKAKRSTLFCFFVILLVDYIQFIRIISMWRLNKKSPFLALSIRSSQWNDIEWGFYFFRPAHTQHDPKVTNKAGVKPPALLFLCNSIFLWPSYFN